MAPAEPVPPDVAAEAAPPGTRMPVRSDQPRPPSPPSATATQEAVSAAVETAVARHKERPGALLPILHDVQQTLGHVPDDAVPEIAQALNLSRAEVHGVVSFYHDFRHAAPGKVVIKVCRAESCQAVGGEAVIAHLKHTLGIDFGQTTADGQFTLEPVYCLGNCALSPALVIGSDIHGRATPDRIDELLRTARGNA